MLTRELAIAEYDYPGGRIIPDRLTRQTHARYVNYAQRMLRVYRNGAGRTRHDLHRDVRSIFFRETDCPPRRMEAFCKLLDDASVYETDRDGNAPALRREVFRLAADRHPLVTNADRLCPSEEKRAKAEIARCLGRSWQDIERRLFADVADYHRLAKFTGYPDAESLLARYNVAQVQVALYDALSLTVWAEDDFKTILRYAKLARLMHTIVRTGDGRFRVRFDGPASVLRQTRRYGAAMARFLPALLACRGWKMHAVVQTRRGGWHLSLDLSPQDGLHSHLPAPADFDSSVEEKFARKWGVGRRNGWRLERESEILHRGQKAFFPDFVFRHDSGRVVLLEIVGFWTPEYLQAKLNTLRAFRDQPVLVAIAESLREKAPQIASGAITFKSTLRIKDVLERLNMVEA